MVFFFILFTSLFYSQSQELPFEKFSVEEGMPTVVNYILQDRIGYLWFATNGGLYKYDGYNFTSYKHDLEDTTSLIDNTLTTLYEDKEGILWIGTWLGLEKFDRLKNTFIHYIPNPSDSGANLDNDVLSICEDRNGVLWVGTSDGLLNFDRTKEKFTYLRHDSTDPGSISHNSINAICKDKEGSLWFGTQVGLDKFDFETGKFFHYWNYTIRQKKTYYNASNYRINSIFGDESGIIWLGTDRGLIEYNPKESTFLNHLFIPKDPINRITSICQDVVSGSLWLATTDGLFSFDKKSKIFTHYNSEANVVYYERSGTLWVGTNIEIKKYNRIKQPFKKYPMNDIACAVGGFGGKNIVWIW